MTVLSLFQKIEIIAQKLNILLHFVTILLAILFSTIRLFKRLFGQFTSILLQPQTCPVLMLLKLSQKFFSSKFFMGIDFSGLFSSCKIVPIISPSAESNCFSSYSGCSKLVTIVLSPSKACSISSSSKFHSILQIMACWQYEFYMVTITKFATLSLSAVERHH